MVLNVPLIGLCILAIIQLRREHRARLLANAAKPDSAGGELVRGDSGDCGHAHSDPGFAGREA